MDRRASERFIQQQRNIEVLPTNASIKKRLKEHFLQNSLSSLRIRVFNCSIKILSCLIYVISVYLDRSFSNGVYKSPNKRLLRFSQDCWNRTNDNLHCINWDAILYYNPPFVLWVLQVVLSVISYVQTVLIVYLSYKGINQPFFGFDFLLDSVISLPFIITASWPTTLRFWYIPAFLNCWLAKRNLESIFNSLHLKFQKYNSIIAHKWIIVSFTLFCFAFIGASTIQHLECGSHRYLSLFQSFWYIIVTFSTVGYGDIYPVIWPSQLFMILLIIATLIGFSSQFQQLISFYNERRVQANSYSRTNNSSNKHVVICSTSFPTQTVMDFLNEFYEDPTKQNYSVVLLSPSVIETNLSIILKTPIWNSRVIYIRGSALNNEDLKRAGMEYAEACFIFSDRHENRATADKHTILRSWAIKDHAPNCVQYIHLHKPNNKIHVQHAKYIVCEDEFKYAVLANNCLCPGVSTLITLLIHTTTGIEGYDSSQEWQKVYGKYSGNELYHIKLEESVFFGNYENKTFSYAAFYAFQEFGVTLLGVKPADDTVEIKLNPGREYILQKGDICYYMSISEESNASFLVNTDKNTSNPTLLQRISNVSCTRKNSNKKKYESAKAKKRLLEKLKSTETNHGSYVQSNSIIIRVDSPEDDDETNDVFEITDTNNETTDSKDTPEQKQYKHSLKPEYKKSYVPCSPYIGYNTFGSLITCHILKPKRQFCCLKLNQPCNHSKAKQAKDYKWKNKIFILCAQNADLSMYNFIQPLRSVSKHKDSLNPLVFMFENDPSFAFLDMISSFPLVYWMKGSIENLEDLLVAGVNCAEYLVIVNKEKSKSNSIEEQALQDCDTILAVQFIFRTFPFLKVCTEIFDSNNMRFMQFRANDKFSLEISKREKIEIDRGSQIAYMFRIPFASGSVFSETMLDTLLYQSFARPYLIKFARLLLGMDQIEGSGHLGTVEIGQHNLSIGTYGNLFRKLAFNTNEIPIAIYRTDTKPPNLSNEVNYLTVTSIEQLTKTRDEIQAFVKTRMDALDINEDYDAKDDTYEYSYVILNPSFDFRLHLGDKIMVICPDTIINNKE